MARSPSGTLPGIICWSVPVTLPQDLWPPPAVIRDKTNAFQSSEFMSLTSPTNFTYKSCCFLTSALISLLNVSKFDLSLLLPVFFAFAWVLFFLRIFLLISGVIHGIEETDLLVFDGICYPLSLEWKKITNQSSPVLNEYPSGYWSIFPLQTQVCLSHRFIITFLI